MGDNSFDNVNVVLPGTLGASAIAPSANMLGVAAVDNMPDRRIDINDATIVTGSGNRVISTNIDSSFNAPGADLSDATITIRNDAPAMVPVPVPPTNRLGVL